jgi:hypothetical protein
MGCNQTSKERILFGTTDVLLGRQIIVDPVVVEEGKEILETIVKSTRLGLVNTDLLQTAVASPEIQITLQKGKLHSVTLGINPGGAAVGNKILVVRRLFHWNARRTADWMTKMAPKRVAV